MIVLILGGGDLASGVALRLFRVGLMPLIAELPQPLAVRRLVSFAEAVYNGRISVEGVSGILVGSLDEALALRKQNKIPVLVNPEFETLPLCMRLLDHNQSLVLIDGRMTKQPADLELNMASFIVGLGPGFVVGKNCHAAIETNRGHNLGRVIWEGGPEQDTGIPESVNGYRGDRVLRAPQDGILQAYVEIGDHLEPGQVVAKIDSSIVKAPFRGVLRGLLHPGLFVQQGTKIGDVDPRDDERMCRLVSDKSLAVGGGVLEAILSRPELRPSLWK
jgi:xanthine dehydrogenase accessory factor